MAGQSQPPKLDAWRRFFMKSNCCIIDTIENAIQVAKIDNPREFKNNRDKIAETLYTNVSTKERPNRALYQKLGLEYSTDSDTGSSTGSNSNVPVKRILGTGTGTGTGAGTVEMCNETDTVQKVLRIKDALMNKAAQEKESVALELLSRLVGIKMSKDTIKRTGIAEVVNSFKKHKAESVRNLALFLIKSWSKIMN